MGQDLFGGPLGEWLHRASRTPRRCPVVGRRCARRRYAGQRAFGPSRPI